MSDTLATQVGGDHYREMKIQPTEFIHANGIGFIAGNVIKYVCRHKAKGGKEDLEKAAHYLQMLIAMEYPEPTPETIFVTPGKWSDYDRCEAFKCAKADCPRWQNGCCDCDPKPKDDDDGWIPWTGGDCPLYFKAKVKARLRDGEVIPQFDDYYKAGSLDWSHRGRGRDIIAYKLA